MSDFLEPGYDSESSDEKDSVGGFVSPSESPARISKACLAPTPTIASENDTPTKGGKTSTPDIRPTTKQDVAKDVDDVIDSGHCHVADSDSFLETILPVDPAFVTHVLNSLGESDQYYNNHWVKFPKSKKDKEQKYHVLLQSISAQVHDLCLQSKRFPHFIPSVWDICGNKTPQTGNPEASKIRPDLSLTALADAKAFEQRTTVLVEQMEEIAAGSKSFRKYLKSLDKNSKSRVPSGLKLEWAEYQRLENELKHLLILWWLQILVPVEVKREYTQKEYNDAIRQLAGYLRQTLREQLDRRFVIGFVLCGSKLSVWLCDRSGLFGMKEPFDINEQPDKFIQVLIALATAAPENLGYDPTMKVFTDYSRSVSIPSYLRNYDSTDMSPDEKNVYLMQWIIEVTADDKVFPYVTLRALSAIGAEVMCGRATIIWEAVKLEDMNSLKEIYVIKQCWRPYSVSDASIISEFEMYSNAGLSHRLIAFEDIRLNGELDSTLEFIRKNLDSSAVPLTQKILESSKVDRPSTQEAFIYRSLFTEETRQDIRFQRNARPNASRAHCRVVQKTWGFPIKFFKDLRELLVSARDAVQGTTV